MVKVAPAHSSPHGHPPEEACSPARGCPLEDPSPRGCRAEAAPVPAGSRRSPPPLPMQEGPGVERSTFLEYVACNTDMQALSSSLADTTITLGKNTARGLGAGGVPAVGRAAAWSKTWLGLGWN